MKKDWIPYIVIFTIIALVFSYGFTALLIKGICFSFGWNFSWKIAFGVWLILMMISGVIKNGQTK